MFGLSGNKFIKTMLNLSRKYGTIRVASDHIAMHAYALDLARLLTDICCYSETDMISPQTKLAVKAGAALYMKFPSYRLLSASFPQHPGKMG